MKTIFEIWKSLFRLKVAKRVMTNFWETYRSAGVQECRSAGVQECRSEGAKERRSEGVKKNDLERTKMTSWAQKVSGAFEKCALGTMSFRQCCLVGSFHGIIFYNQT